MSVITELPTTPGSIVSFEGWEDLAHTVRCRYVVTLVPGSYDRKTGKFSDVLWMDLYAEGELYNISEEEILKGDPKVLFEASEVTSTPALVEGGALDADEAREYGSIALLDSSEYGETTVATFTPGSLDEDGKIIEGGWMNSYGAWFSQSTIEDEAVALLVKGSLEDI